MRKILNQKKSRTVIFKFKSTVNFWERDSLLAARNEENVPKSKLMWFVYCFMYPSGWPKSHYATEGNLLILLSLPPSAEMASIATSNICPVRNQNQGFVYEAARAMWVLRPGV